MKDNKPLVSIIMPVYNGERFLSEAIDSIIAQTYENWELLAVDDGSDDNSVSIIEKYAQKDSRIKLYINDSGEHGPGIARNYGIERISGKYTYFIDADDWIEKDLLKCTVALAEQTDADIVPFGYFVDDGEKSIKYKLSPSGNFVFDDFKDIANEIVRGTWGECHQLTKSEIIKDVRHNKHRTCEDSCFEMDLLRNVKKVCGIDKEYHHYRQVSDSISHKVTWDGSFAETCITLFNKEKEFLEFCGVDEGSQTMKNTAFERYTGCIYWICKRKYPLTLSEKYKQIKHIGDAVEISKYKKNFDCSKYHGIRKIAKFLVKHNLEAFMLFCGTVYFKIFG